MFQRYHTVETFLRHLRPENIPEMQFAINKNSSNNQHRLHQVFEHLDKHFWCPHFQQNSYLEVFHQPRSPHTLNSFQCQISSTYINIYRSDDIGRRHFWKWQHWSTITANLFSTIHIISTPLAWYQILTWGCCGTYVREIGAGPIAKLRKLFPPTIGWLLPLFCLRSKQAFYIQHNNSLLS